MNKPIVGLNAAIVIMLTGCGGGVPNCSDEATVELIKQSYFATFGDLGDANLNAELKANYTITVDNIRTVRQSEKPEKFTCAAEVAVKPSEMSKKLYENLVNSLAIQGKFKNYADLHAEGLKIMFKDNPANPAQLGLMMGFVSQVVPTLSAYGSDLSRYRTAVNYVSESAKSSDGKEKHLVSANFNVKLPLDQLFLADLAIYAGQQAVDAREKAKNVASTSIDKSSVPQAIIRANEIAEQKSGTDTKSEPASEMSAQATPHAAPPVVLEKSLDASQQRSDKVYNAEGKQTSDKNETNIVQSPNKETPSFDCAKAASKVEVAICSNPELSKADRNLNHSYRSAMQIADSEKLKKSQRAWIGMRNNCTDDECIGRAYSQRQSELNALITK